MQVSNATTLGFIGTGEISKATVTGLIEHGGIRDEIWLSPRSERVARELAEKYGNVRIATNNQQVVDNARTVFLAVRPQDAGAILPSLRFSDQHLLISLIAGYSCAKVFSGCGSSPARVVRAVPFASIANGNCKTLVFPKDEEVEQLLSSVGGYIPMSSESHLDTMVATSATMELFFRVLDTYARWAADRGIHYQAARDYLANQYEGLVQIANSTAVPFDTLSKQFTTKGGLNELVVDTFDGAGGFTVLRNALDSVEKRLLAK